MAEIKACANVFALLDGDDPGDKRLADFDIQHKDQHKKQPVSAAACDYKLKLTKPAAAGSMASRKSPTPAPVAAGRRSTAAASMAKSVNKKSTTPIAPSLPSTNYTAALFAKAYPSARERIFKQRQEEFERRQAKVADNGGSVSGGDDGKTAAAGAPSAGYGKGKTHGARVQQYYYNGSKQPRGIAAKEALSPPTAEEPTAALVVLQTPLPSPSIHDTAQFPSLN